MKHKRKTAFTMAELMITIGIVGVVAAITIPLLIQNSNYRKFTTQFKKSLSTLNQAAISAQAQYDMDYASLSSPSDPATCGRDRFSNSSATMCALFNSTLVGKHYLGVYGEVKGPIFTSKYQFNKTTEGFDPTNFLIYSLADGSLVGFNPNAKRCSLESGQIINKSILTDPNGLANCIGFIDVNGVTAPNKEVTCSDGTSALEPNNPCTLKSKPWGLGDVFPIVFHNGTVEPATNAAKAFFATSASGGGAGDDKVQIGTGASGEPIYITRKEYERRKAAGPNYRYTIDGEDWYLYNGAYYRKDSDGNLVNLWDSTYTKTSDGYERTSGSYKYVYDNDLNPIGQYYKGTYYEYKNGFGYVRDAGDGTGNLVSSGANTFTKTSDGYERTNGPYKYVYDKDLNLLGEYYNGTYYELKNGHYVRDAGDGTGNLVSPGGYPYTKTSDGYEYTSGSYKYVYDNNLNLIGQYYNGNYYEKKGNLYIRKENANFVDINGYPYTKTSDGLYTNGNFIYDENFVPILHIPGAGYYGT